MDTVKLTINGQEINVPQEYTILQAAQEAGIDIPTLCYHPDLSTFNSCLLCVVEVEKARRPLLACGTRVSEGMVVTTNSELIQNTRRVALELLLSEHCGDCLGPCQIACPAHCDIQGFIHCIAEGDDPGALRIIKNDIPLPVALGCVCPAPCEEDCRRTRVEEPMAIRVLKRYAGEQDLAQDKPYKPELTPDTGKKVAVIGAGPAGLSAAYYLRQMGHAVTIFEAQPEAGGMLRYGIPAYRMPREKLAAEIETITGLGIEVRYNTRLGCDITVNDLLDQFDALFLGIGAQGSRQMRIPGEESQSVLGGVDFLARVAKGEQVNVGRRVAVIGGGNTAIDASRTAIRLGAEVKVLYRRSQQEMPAWDIEVDAAEEEGVEFHFLVSPTAVQETADGLQVTNIRMELGPPDASGRRRPVPIPGSEFTIECDSMIMAIGQVVDSACLEQSGVELDRRSCIVVDEQTLQTSIPGVFAGGDGVTGPDIAVRAVGAGHRAAISIDQYLKGEQVTGAQELWGVSMGTLEQVTADRFAHVEKQPRTHIPERSPEERRRTFDEVEQSLSPEQARGEAKRCLECGCSAVDTCLLRQYAIEYDADPLRFGGDSKPYSLDETHPALRFEPGKCILCGLCVRMCTEVKGLRVFAFSERGFDANIQPYFGLTLGETTCDGCLKCVEVCPTGTLSARIVAETEKA